MKGILFWRGRKMTEKKMKMKNDIHLLSQAHC